MDKETSQPTSALVPNTDDASIKQEALPLGCRGGGGVNIAASLGGACGGGDRLKRDEWSEGAVSSLLDAYEKKWVLRNRAKLKGHDWEDVARHVSSRASFSKSPKTQTQCKNKIESMKKRYRSEFATSGPSSWPLYPRLDLLLRGNGATTLAAGPPPPPPPQQLQQTTAPLLLLEPPTAVGLPTLPPLPPPAPFPPVAAVIAHNSHGSNGVDREAQDEGAKLSDYVSDKHAMETDGSTPALCGGDGGKQRSKKRKMRMEKKKRKRREEWEKGDSIRWLAEAVVRTEKARIEAMRELEKMRIEAEAKRGEMDLKRTQIIATTQLEIAKLFAGAADEAH